MHVPFLPQYDYPSNAESSIDSNEVHVDSAKRDSTSCSRWDWAEREAAALGSLPSPPQESRSVEAEAQWVLTGVDAAAPRTPLQSTVPESAGKLLIRNTARRLSHLAEVYPIATSLRTPSHTAGSDSNSSFQAVTPLGSEADSVESISPLVPQLRLRRGPGGVPSTRMSTSTLSPLHKATLKEQILTESSAGNNPTTNEDGGSYSYASTPVKLPSLPHRRGANEGEGTETPVSISPSISQRSPFVSSFRSVRIAVFLSALF